MQLGRENNDLREKVAELEQDIAELHKLPPRPASAGDEVKRCAQACIERIQKALSDAANHESGASEFEIDIVIQQAIDSALSASHREVAEITREREQWRITAMNNDFTAAEFRAQLATATEQLQAAQRGLKAAEKALKEIWDATDPYADGVIDASAHDKLCNEISGIARPWGKRSI